LGVLPKQFPRARNKSPTSGQGSSPGGRCQKPARLSLGFSKQNAAFFAFFGENHPLFADLACLIIAFFVACDNLAIDYQVVQHAWM
jgi:hypothetical protein